MIEKCRIIELPKITDRRGNLSFVEGGKHIPFDIKRVYWIYDVPGGAKRGGHAFRRQDEFIISLSGSFSVTLHDCVTEAHFTLNRSYLGLLVPRMTWRQMDSFSTNSVALVLASTPYDPDDYIHDFQEFRKIVHE
jgi:hypothetical protein